MTEMLWNVLRALFFAGWTFAVYAYGEWCGAQKILRGVRRMVEDVDEVQKDTNRVLDQANELAAETRELVKKARKGGEGHEQHG